MSVFGMNVNAWVLDEELNRPGKWKVELVLVTAMILLTWLDSSQAGESLNSVSYTHLTLPTICSV